MVEASRRPPFFPKTSFKFSPSSSNHEDEAMCVSTICHEELLQPAERQDCFLSFEIADTEGTLSPALGREHDATCVTNQTSLPMVEDEELLRLAEWAPPQDLLEFFKEFSLPHESDDFQDFFKDFDWVGFGDLEGASAASDGPCTSNPAPETGQLLAPPTTAPVKKIHPVFGKDAWKTTAPSIDASNYYSHPLPVAPANTIRSTSKQDIMPLRTVSLPSACAVSSTKNAQKCHLVLPIEQLPRKKKTQKPHFMMPPIIHPEIFYRGDVQEIQCCALSESNDPLLQASVGQGRGQMESGRDTSSFLTFLPRNPDEKKGEKRPLNSVDISGHLHSCRETKQQRTEKVSKQQNKMNDPHPLASSTVAGLATMSMAKSQAMPNVGATAKSPVGLREQAAKETVWSKASTTPTLAALLSPVITYPISGKFPTFPVAIPAVKEQGTTKSRAITEKTTPAATAVDAPAPAQAAVIAPGPRKAPNPTKKRSTCILKGCTNIAHKGGCCVRHGGKQSKPMCKHEGCTNRVINNGRCTRHGAQRRICNHEGCTNVVVKGGVCVRHGAKQSRKTCKHKGCNNVVVRGGVCVGHGANWQKTW